MAVVAAASRSGYPPDRSKKLLVMATALVAVVSTALVAVVMARVAAEMWLVRVL